MIYLSQYNNMWCVMLYYYCACGYRESEIKKSRQYKKNKDLFYGHDWWQQTPSYPVFSILSTMATTYFSVKSLQQKIKQVRLWYLFPISSSFFGLKQRKASLSLRFIRLVWIGQSNPPCCLLFCWNFLHDFHVFNHNKTNFFDEENP